MKIGILTFHRVINNGAVMQAYSLQNRIQQDFPDDNVEIIDYNPNVREVFKIKTPLIFAYRRSVREAIQKAKQTIEFNKATKRFKLSKRLIGKSEKKIREYIEKVYDLVVVGSDAVFNWNDLGLPNMYFLSDVHVKHKASYSASAHLQNYRKITEEQKEYLRSSLGDFEYIGVRDENTNNFVKYILPEKETRHNCDPSIFLKMDYDDGKLIKKMEKNGFDFSQKTVFVMLMKSEYGEFVKRYFKDCQIVALMDGNPYADIYLYDLNPFEWGKVFSYGSFLITDYFHGTIFGIKNNIPVLSIDSSGYGNSKQGYESKAKDLLEKRLDLPYYYINANDLIGETGYEVFAQKIEQINTSFNKEKVIDALENEALSYLDFRRYLEDLHKETCYEKSRG